MPQLATVPTDIKQYGNFVGLENISAPATTRPNPAGAGCVRNQFPRNLIPVCRLDPKAQKVLALCPESRLPWNVNFRSPQVENVYNDQSNGRIDHCFSDMDSVFGRYMTSRLTDRCLQRCFCLPATQRTQLAGAD